MQRRCVVDTVAQTTDHVTARAKGLHDGVLLRRRNAREHRRPLGDGSKGRISQAVEIIAHDNRSAIETCSIEKTKREGIRTLLRRDGGLAAV